MTSIRRIRPEGVRLDFTYAAFEVGEDGGGRETNGGP